MMHGHPLSATLPEDSGLGERFWYWRGASGQRYIHSIYRRDLCPPVAGAVFVIVRARDGSRRAVASGRFTTEAMANTSVTSRLGGWTRRKFTSIFLPATRRAPGLCCAICWLR